MKTALVTGGASGIGLEVAKKLAGDFEVAIVDLRKHPEFLCFEADVRDRGRAREIVESLPNLEALVTCAGSRGDWDDVLAIDLTGTWNYIEAVTPAFKRRKSGTIVTISATTGIEPQRNLTAHSAAKAGVIGLTRAAAREGIHANSVAPGPIGKGVTAEDVANVVAFLCSERARGINGEVIRVDGGQLA